MRRNGGLSAVTWRSDAPRATVSWSRGSMVRIGGDEAAAVPAPGAHEDDRPALDRNEAAAPALRVLRHAGSIDRRDGQDFLDAGRAAGGEREAGLAEAAHASATGEASKLRRAGAGDDPIAEHFTERHQLVDRGATAEAGSGAGGTTRSLPRHERLAVPARGAQGTEGKRVVTRARGADEPREALRDDQGGRRGHQGGGEA